MSIFFKRLLGKKKKLDFALWKGMSLTFNEIPSDVIFRTRKFEGDYVKDKIYHERANLMIKEMGLPEWYPADKQSIKLNPDDKIMVVADCRDGINKKAMPL